MATAGTVGPRGPTAAICGRVRKQLGVMAKELWRDNTSVKSWNERYVEKQVCQVRSWRILTLTRSPDVCVCFSGVHVELYSPKNEGRCETFSRNVFVSTDLLGGSSWNWLSSNRDMFLARYRRGRAARAAAATDLGWKEPGTVFLSDGWGSATSPHLSVCLSSQQVGNNAWTCWKGAECPQNTHTTQRASWGINYTLLCLRQGLFSTTEAVVSYNLQEIRHQVWLQGGK